MLHRPRRLRHTQNLRNLVQQTRPSPHQLVYPLFVEEEITEKQPIASMPGISRIPEKHLAEELKSLQKQGLNSFLFFGVSHHKDETGADSWAADGLLARILKRARDAVPEATLIADNCFCEYTTHGHCGVIDAHGHVHNDQTLENLARQAVSCARAGASMLAPSAMMDGQVAAIRHALDAAGFSHLPIMAYASKFASALYGPFRAAAGCELKGDRKTYQMNPANSREALHEAALDEAEGADILMVKPAGFYLDILARLRSQSNLPLAAYQVSGEYAMHMAAIQNGWLSEGVILESLTAFKRAGADGILTYFAVRAAQLLREQK